MLSKNNLRYTLFFLLTLLFSSNVISQECNCDYTLTREQLNHPELNIIWGEQLAPEPGSTICIASGTYKAIRFYDIHGTEEAPITIKNCGGQVKVLAPSYSALSFQRSSHIRITGSGSDKHEYGILLAFTNKFSSAIYMENFTTDFEIDHIEIAQTGFAGIMAKTDPYCDKPDTWRRSGFIQKNIKIHNNYIHDIGGEGIYLGFTGGYKYNTNRNCDGDPIFGHWLENIEIYDNVIEKVGLDGIQVNLARKNCKIYRNKITNYASEELYFQNFAMSLGGGEYEVFDNYILNGEPGVGGNGNGIQLISAESGTKIYNNIIDQAKFHGIFIHQRHGFKDTEMGYAIFNNTIINPENSGIHYNTTITASDDSSKLSTQQDDVPSYFMNNFILAPGNLFEGGNTWKQYQESFIDFNNRSTRDAMQPYIKANFFARNAEYLHITETNTDVPFSFSSSDSPLIDAGVDVSEYGLNTDISGSVRPIGIGFDIGAYEFLDSASTDGPSKTNNGGNNNSKMNYTFFPNPMKEYFQIIGPDAINATISIFSQMGVFLEKIENYQGESILIDTFNPGVFYVNISKDGKLENFTLVKE